MNFRYCKDCVNRKVCHENNWVTTMDRLKTYKKEIVCDNFNTEHWGIYNTMQKQFQFGIDEPSRSKANNKLLKKIGYDAYKWRFEAKILPRELWKRK